MNQYFLEKAEAIKPVLNEDVVRPVWIPDGIYCTGDRIVLDFGNHFVGRFFFRMHGEGSHQDAPALLKVKFCEVKKEIEEDSSRYQGWICASWIQEERIHVDVLPAEVAMPRRYAFRYVVIDITAVSDKYGLVLDDAYAKVTTSAEDAALTVYQGNAKEMRMDEVALRTLRNCMQDVFEDGPKRDRRLWLGDLRLEALTNYVSYGNYSLVKRCMYLFAAVADEEGRIPACLFTEPEVCGDDTYMFDYSLFFIAALYDYAAVSKDLETTRELYKTARRQWELAQENFDENHVVRDSDVLGWCFLDWNLELNKQAGAQFVYLYCAKRLCLLAELLEIPEDITEIKRDMALKKQAALDYFYDREKELFVSGSKKQISYASQVWGVLSECLEKEENIQVLEHMRRCKDAVEMVTPYMNHCYVEALIQVGMEKEAYAYMMHYWGGMMEDGADTFYELFNPGNPSESPYGSCIVNSYCHAWSCTPAYFLRKYNLHG